MSYRKSLAGLALIAVLVTGGMVKADETPAPAPRKPLMELFDKAGIGKPLDDAGISLYGEIEGSYSYNFSNPTGDITPLRSFDQEHNEVLLNQINLSVERAVTAAKDKWVWGFKVEQTYGEDSRFTHSNGLTIYSPANTGSATTSNPEVQYDINQFYVDIGAPVGNGLLIRIGKWYTLVGYEVVLPTGNALFSHSFLFANAPYAHTGALLSYNLSDEMGVQAGVTRGWDQFEDNNGELGLIGQYWYKKEKYAGYINVVTGNETSTGSGWRTLIDYWATYAFSDQITLGINADYGWEAQKDPSGGTGIWYGVAGYAGYKVNDMFTVNGRLEWFDDQDASAPSGQGITNVFYEATLGVTIKPMPNDKILSNLMLRPEIRVDYADKPTIDGDHYQTTAAIDAIFTY